MSAITSWQCQKCGAVWTDRPVGDCYQCSLRAPAPAEARVTDEQAIARLVSITNRGIATGMPAPIMLAALETHLVRLFADSLAARDAELAKLRAERAEVVALLERMLNNEPCADEAYTMLARLGGTP